MNHFIISARPRFLPVLKDIGPDPAKNFILLTYLIDLRFLK